MAAILGFRFNLERAWFDGVALNKSSKMAEVLVCNLFRKRKKQLDKTIDELLELINDNVRFSYRKDKRTMNLQIDVIEPFDRIIAVRWLFFLIY